MQRLNSEDPLLGLAKSMYSVSHGMKLTFLYILFLLADKEKEKLLSELKHYRKTFMRIEVRILLINRYLILTTKFDPLGLSSNTVAKIMYYRSFT